MEIVSTTWSLVTDTPGDDAFIVGVLHNHDDDEAGKLAKKPVSCLLLSWRFEIVTFLF